MKGDEKPKPATPLTDEQLRKFGDFAGSADTKDIAKYLMKKGMIGAEQLYTDQPDTRTAAGITNAQSDWKAAAISKMLMRARALNIRTPTQVMANKKALLGSMDERYQSAINNPVFNQVHPNFWQTFNGILGDRYASELPVSSPSLAVK